MRNKLTLSYPASFWTAKWRDALPAGNGKLGAAVYGAVHQETILLNHEDLWTAVPKQPLPDISDSLAEQLSTGLTGCTSAMPPVTADFPGIFLQVKGLPSRLATTYFEIEHCFAAFKHSIS